MEHSPRPGWHSRFYIYLYSNKYSSSGCQQRDRCFLSESSPGKYVLQTCRSQGAYVPDTSNPLKLCDCTSDMKPGGRLSHLEDWVCFVQLGIWCHDESYWWPWHKRLWNVAQIKYSCCLQMIRFAYILASPTITFS
jgi:hypothetical protein